MTFSFELEGIARAGECAAEAGSRLAQHQPAAWMGGLGKQEHARPCEVG